MALSTPGVSSTIAALAKMSSDDDKLTTAFVYTENEKMKDDSTRTQQVFATQKSEEVLELASRAEIA